MRITESQLRRIISEEAQKLKRGKKINESQASAENLLSNAMDEYIDEMNRAGFGYDEICKMMQSAVSSYCETFLSNLAPGERDFDYGAEYGIKRSF